MSIEVEISLKDSLFTLSSSAGSLSESFLLPKQTRDLFQRRIGTPGIKCVIHHHAVLEHIVIILEVERKTFRNRQ